MGLFTSESTCVINFKTERGKTGRARITLESRFTSDREIADRCISKLKEKMEAKGEKVSEILNTTVTH